MLLYHSILFSLSYHCALIVGAYCDVLTIDGIGPCFHADILISTVVQTVEFWGVRIAKEDSTTFAHFDNKAFAKLVRRNRYLPSLWAMDVHQALERNVQTDARLALRRHCYRNDDQRQELANSSMLPNAGKQSELPDFGTSARVIKADTSGYHRSRAISGRPKNNCNHLYSLNRRRYPDPLSTAVACTNRKGRCV